LVDIAFGWMPAMANSDLPILGVLQPHCFRELEFDWPLSGDESGKMTVTSVPKPVITVSR
jgi:hypothetical protein